MSTPIPPPVSVPPPITAAQVRAWAGGPISADDDLITFVISSEVEAQARVCDRGGDPARASDPMPQALVLALFRRVARALAARGVTLGVVGTDSEYGSTSLPRYDAEIERYERPYRVVSIA